MEIDRLLELIPPPSSPFNAPGDWETCEQQFGVIFPRDFKELLRNYGTGRFCGELRIHNPLEQSGRDRIEDDLARYRELRDACEYPLALHPETPGLLPWGSDSNGHLYCWWTKGNENDWGIVQLFHGYEDEIEVVPGPITSFLVRFFLNEHPNMVGGSQFTKEQYYFKQKSRPA